MLPGLSSFLCLYLLVTLFLAQISGTSSVCNEIFNIFNIYWMYSNLKVSATNFLHETASKECLAFGFSPLLMPGQWHFQSLSAPHLQLIPTDLPIPTWSQMSPPGQNPSLGSLTPLKGLFKEISAVFQKNKMVTKQELWQETKGVTSLGVSRGCLIQESEFPRIS